VDQVKVLQDGFWERTTVVRDSCGELSVRKESTSAGVASPWGQTALREEIQFLSSVPNLARHYYPPLLDRWDDRASESVGYRIPFYGDYENVSDATRSGTLSQAEADNIQGHLSKAILEATHQPAPDTPIVPHIRETLEHTIAHLRALPEFTVCVDSPEIAINGSTLRGLIHAYHQVRNSKAMTTLESLPTVRLHGDLILENILWNTSAEPPLRLIDPVSVAGIWRGPAAFDLVKYASYATGELFALRSGAIQAGPTSGDCLSFVYTPTVIPAFTEIDLLSGFASAFEAHHGPRNPHVEHLLDGYFSLVMAVNTRGIQRWGRVLKGILALNAATEMLDT